MFSNEIFPVLAICPEKPPAKVSPAPVGSKTSSKGNAGAKKHRFHETIMLHALLF